MADSVLVCVVSVIGIFINIFCVQSQPIFLHTKRCYQNGYSTSTEPKTELERGIQVERYGHLKFVQNNINKCLKKIMVKENKLLERKVKQLLQNSALNKLKCDIDECLSDPCQNNGKCIDMTKAYQCSCGADFQGKHCEIDINECFSRPCQNKGTCIDLINSYRCNCAPGFKGRNCENNINECLSRPCQNRGTCRDLINSYRCNCAPGFNGRNCEININECLSRPCQNRGICRDLINSYRCNCAPGFNGRNCETNINECLSRPCQNKGTCRDLINSYRCNCAPGFNGRNCEININECLSRPCQNRGTCRDLINSYRCNCAPGFKGRNCEITLSCQGGWTKFNTKCYFFDSSITRTWTDAMRYCEDRGGTLAVPSNSYENDFLKDIGHNSDLNSIWIGISDSSTEGRWLIYPDRVLISFYTFTDWSPGEPSQTWNGEEEDCGCMSGYSNIRYRWNDAPCSRHFNFICEKELS